MTQPVIIITGCSSGIGAHCARRLKSTGWQVLASAVKEDDVAELQAEGFDAHQLDYADGDSIDRFFDFALDAANGRIDAIYNNGAYGQAGAVEDISTEALRAQLEVNFFGWHHLTQKVIPIMRMQGHGRIINCSSILGLIPVRLLGAYTASKFAVEGLTQTLALELYGTGIQVSLIEPGPINTKIADNAMVHMLKHIDIQNSNYRDEYKVRLQRMKQGKLNARQGGSPELVYKAVYHALTASRAKPHYHVTMKAKIGAAMRRLLPSRLLYKILAELNR